MAAYKDEEWGTWYVSFHYNDWTGKNKRKLKRGFRTRKEALEYEQKFLLQQATNLDMRFYKPRHTFTKGKVEALNKSIAWLIPYEGEFETEEELIAILSKINKKVCERICDETDVPPLLLFQKEKEYPQSLPSEKVLESYLTHDRQTTVRKDSMITYMKNKYSVPADYVGKPVRLKVSNESLQIYYSTDLIATHLLSDKRLNYKKEHYTQLLAGYIKNDDDIAVLAEINLRQMDALL